MKHLIGYVILIIAGILHAGNSVRISNMSGEVKIRRGLDENWQMAHNGMNLEPLDTILTGEKGQVKLALPEGSFFVLGANAILDIADLRRISRRELILIITSEKIERLPQHKKRSGMHFENVNVLHGERKVEKKVAEDHNEMALAWMRNRNGGVDLLEQQFYTNAIVKFHKILKAYNEVKDCGEIYYYLGQAFEGLQSEGQALEAYTNALKMNTIDDCKNASASIRREATQNAIQKLKR